MVLGRSVLRGQAGEPGQPGEHGGGNGGRGGVGGNASGSGSLHRALFWVIALIALGWCVQVGLNRLYDNTDRVAKSATEQRQNLRRATVTVIGARCASENQLRRELRDLVKAGRDNLQQYHDRGLLTDGEYKETLVDQADALRRLQPRNCKELQRVFQLHSLGKQIPRQRSGDG